MTRAAIHDQERAAFRLSRSVFLLFQELVHTESGIWLGEHKKMLLSGRLAKRLRQLELVVISEWKRQADAGERARMLNIWSAGCSSGEEPYSILMVLLDYFPPESGWSIRVLGTDISTRVLEKAERGRWS